MRISKRLVLGITIPILILGLGLFLVFAVFKTAKVYIMIAPENATITINGRKVKNGEHNLFPGTKTIKVSGEGIEDYETQIDAKMFSCQRIAVYRKVNGSYDSYIKSRSDYLVLKMLSSEQNDPDATAFLQKVEQAKKIFEDLPQEINNTIEYGEGSGRTWEVERATIMDYSNNENCPAAICILIKAKHPEKVDTKILIEQRGYKLDDYYIVRKKTDA
jgi:hypothetical protein